MFTRIYKQTLTEAGVFSIQLGVRPLQLIMIFSVRSTGTEDAPSYRYPDNVYLYYNGDFINANYHYNMHRWGKTLGHLTQEADLPQVGICPESHAPAGVFSYGTATWYNLLDDAMHRWCLARSDGRQKDDGISSTSIEWTQWESFHRWDSNAVITQLDLRPDGYGGGDLFDVGSIVELWALL